MLTSWVDLHTLISGPFKDTLLVSWIREGGFVKRSVESLIPFIVVCAELLLMKNFHLEHFHLWWFITVLFLMFMPHIVSQRISFSWQSPLRVLYISETALSFGAKREALWTTGWNFGDELLKSIFVENDHIYDSVTRGYRHLHFKTEFQGFHFVVGWSGLLPARCSPNCSLTPPSQQERRRKKSPL